MEGTERTEGGGRDVRRPARDVDPRTPAPTARRASERGAGGRQRGTDIAKGYEVLLTEEAREYIRPLRERLDRRTTPARWKHDRVREAVNAGVPLTEAIWGMQAEYVDRQSETLIEGSFVDWL